VRKTIILGKNIILIMFITLGFVISENVFAAEPSDSNSLGKIYCKTNSGDYTSISDSTVAIDCTIDQDQNVIFGESTPSQHIFTFTNLIVDNDIVLSFSNSRSINVAGSGGNGGSASDDADSSEDGGAATTNTYTSSTGVGGNGGKSGRYNGYDDEAGGGGGAGGSGGKISVKGGGGGTGGHGSDHSGTTGGGNGGMQGSDIKLIISGELKLRNENSKISVNGQDGIKGNDGNSGSGSTGGDGGGGGGGGGGAGKIYITTSIISGLGEITAQGGAGGAGGNGHNGEEKANGGGGGGGGGGDGGTISVLANNIQGDVKISCAGGIGGVEGSKGGTDDGGAAGSSGSTGKSGSCYGSPQPNSETDPAASGTDNPLLCNNNLDDDNDSFINMCDSDCFVTGAKNNEWSNDGPISPTIFYGQVVSPATEAPLEQGIMTYSDYTSWDPSATSGLDAVCGDDIAPEGCSLKIQSCNQLEYNACSSSCSWIESSPATCTGGECDCDAFSTDDQYGSGCDGRQPAGCESRFNNGRYVCEGTYTCEDLSTEDCADLCCVYTPPVESSSCTGTIDPSLCSGTSCDNTFCVDHTQDAPFTNDYGTITGPTVNGANKYNYMCYNNIADLRSPAKTDDTNFPAWDWKDAADQDTAFKIFTLQSSSGKTVDVISNSEEWFYCNADSTITTGLNGREISDGNTFDGVYGDSITCGQILTNLDGDIFTDGNCADVDYSFCCEGNNGEVLSVDLSSVSDPNTISVCNGKCYIAEGNLITDLSCSPTYPLLCDNSLHTLGTGTDGSDSLRDITDCPYIVTDCIGDVSYTDTGSCTGNGGEICTNDPAEYCSGGYYIQTTESGQSSPQENRCCYVDGGGAECKIIPVLTTVDECNAIGTVFDPQISDCEGDTASISDDPSVKCCLGYTYSTINSLVLTTMFYKNSPLSFKCFQRNGNNVIAQCIYDDSAVNADLIKDGVMLDKSYGRIYAGGATTTTLLSNDVLDSSGVVHDKFIQLYLLNTGKTNIGALTSGYSVLLSDYISLEFDVGYPSKGKDVNLIVLTKTSPADTPTEYSLGRLSEYLSGAERVGRWLHVIVPISDLEGLTPQEYYYALQFNDVSNNPYYLALDKIRLVASESIPYYCTGPYGTWISELDPTEVDPTPTDTASYQYACEVQITFDWTGNYCCGDDKRYDDDAWNYGEYFTDTAKGCFNSSKIQNDWTVAYVYNKKEIGTPIDRESFESFQYKDLKYFNNNFIGCQVPTNKYATLKISYDGIKKSDNNPLFDVNNNQVAQCSVVGSHYCMDNAWRKNIAGYTLPSGETLTSANLVLKSAPPGLNLIRNGDFSGTGTS